jgi:hypothetical protein
MIYLRLSYFKHEIEKEKGRKNLSVATGSGANPLGPGERGAVGRVGTLFFLQRQARGSRKNSR